MIAPVAIDQRPEVGVFVEAPSELTDELSVGLSVGVRDRLEGSVLDGLDVGRCRSGQGRSTPGAEASGVADGSSALRALVEVGARPIASLGFESVVLGDLSVHLDVGDTRIRLELAAVFDPAGPVLDCLLGNLGQ